MQSEFWFGVQCGGSIFGFLGAIGMMWLASDARWLRLREQSRDRLIADLEIKVLNLEMELTMARSQPNYIFRSKLV